MKTRLILAFWCLAIAARAAMTEEEIRTAYYKSYGYEKSQAYADSIKVLGPVLDASPQGYIVNLRLGWLNYLNGSHATSLARYEVAMKAAPESIEARLGYLLPLLAQERYTEAEAAARQIVRVDPANYFGNLRLAFALRLQKKHEAAEEIVSRQLVFYPTDISFQLELGLLKVARNQPEEARRIFHNVITLDPENITAKTQLSRLAVSGGSRNN